jgi:M6 family metalloprotease-like protein
MKALLGRAAVVAAATLPVFLTPLAAQQWPVEKLITANGVRLEYPPDAVWQVKARNVAQARARMRAQGNLRALNAPALLGLPQPAATAVSGNLRFPTILIGYYDTNVGALPDTAEYDSVTYTAQPLSGGAHAGSIRRPYTVRTFYEEMSHGLLTISGKTYGWITDPDPTHTQSYFLEACGAAPANALDCTTGQQRMYQLFVYALQRLDSMGVDFTQFDANGDGQVDMVEFVQPVVGAECYGAQTSPWARGVWAHHFTLAGWGGVYHTHDGLTVGPYQIISGVGGQACTDTTQIMGVGTSAHETGHGFGLPDLYDVSSATEGVGEWSLMGSGNYTSLLSPAHMDGWSKEQLGWVVVRELTAAGSYQLGPVVTGDTVMMIRPRGGNPRGEVFLLENKQAIGSDSANMTSPGSPKAIPKQGGLVVWHADSTKLTNNGLATTNSVNAGYPHGLELVQADDSFQLDLARGAGGNRGDAGDPYPGTATNRSLSGSTAPAAVMNDDSSFAGFALSAVNQDVPNGQMSFGLSFATIIRPSDTLAHVIVSGTRYHRFVDVLSPDSAVTVDVPAADTSDDGRARFTFNSWSDGGARQHQIMAATVPDSLIATVDASYQLKVTTVGPKVGTVASSPAADLVAGTYFSAGTVVTLVAQGGPDSVFSGWSGDTTTARDTLVLVMQRPYAVSARFVALDAVVDQLLGVDSLLTTDEIQYFDDLGNRNNRLDLGDFLAWVKRADVQASAAVMARVLSASAPERRRRTP